MARSNRTRQDIEQLRERIYAMWCDAATWAQIAAAVGLTDRQCRNHLNARQAAVRHRDESTDRSLLAREQAIGFYEAQKRRALEEFERSRVDATKKKQKAREKAGETESAAEQSTESRVGQAALLRVANDAQKEIDALNQLPKGPRGNELPAGLVNVVFYIPENGRDNPQAD